MTVPRKFILVGGFLLLIGFGDGGLVPYNGSKYGNSRPNSYVGKPISASLTFKPDRPERPSPQGGTMQKPPNSFATAQSTVGNSLSHLIFSQNGGVPNTDTVMIVSTSQNGLNETMNVPTEQISTTHDAFTAGAVENATYTAAYYAPTPTNIPASNNSAVENLHVTGVTADILGYPFPQAIQAGAEIHPQEIHYATPNLAEFTAHDSVQVSFPVHPQQEAAQYLPAEQPSNEIFAVPEVSHSNNSQMPTANIEEVISSINVESVPVELQTAPVLPASPELDIPAHSDIHQTFNPLQTAATTIDYSPPAVYESPQHSVIEAQQSYSAPPTVPVVSVEVPVQMAPTIIDYSPPETYQIPQQSVIEAQQSYSAPATVPAVSVEVPLEMAPTTVDYSLPEIYESPQQSVIEAQQSYSAPATVPVVSIEVPSEPATSIPSKPSNSIGIISNTNVQYDEDEHFFDLAAYLAQANLVLGPGAHSTEQLNEAGASIPLNNLSQTAEEPEEDLSESMTFSVGHLGAPQDHHSQPSSNHVEEQVEQVSAPLLSVSNENSIHAEVMPENVTIAQIPIETSDSIAVIDFTQAPQVHQEPLQQETVAINEDHVIPAISQQPVSSDIQLETLSQPQGQTPDQEHSTEILNSESQNTGLENDHDAIITSENLSVDLETAPSPQTEFSFNLNNENQVQVAETHDTILEASPLDESTQVLHMENIASQSSLEDVINGPIAPTFNTTANNESNQLPMHFEETMTDVPPAPLETPQEAFSILVNEPLPVFQQAAAPANIAVQPEETMFTAASSIQSAQESSDENSDDDPPFDVQQYLAQAALLLGGSPHYSPYYGYYDREGKQGKPSRKSVSVPSNAGVPAAPSINSESSHKGVVEPHYQHVKPVVPDAAPSQLGRARPLRPGLSRPSLLGVAPVYTYSGGKLNTPVVGEDYMLTHGSFSAANSKNQNGTLSTLQDAAEAPQHSMVSLLGSHTINSYFNGSQPNATAAPGQGSKVPSVQITPAALINNALLNAAFSSEGPEAASGNETETEMAAPNPLSYQNYYFPQDSVKGKYNVTYNKGSRVPQDKNRNPQEESLIPQLMKTFEDEGQVEKDNQGLSIVELLAQDRRKAAQVRRVTSLGKSLGRNMTYPDELNETESILKEAIHSTRESDPDPDADQPVSEENLEDDQIKLSEDEESDNASEEEFEEDSSESVSDDSETVEESEVNENKLGDEEIEESEEELEQPKESQTKPLSNVSKDPLSKPAPEEVSSNTPPKSKPAAPSKDSSSKLLPAPEANDSPPKSQSASPVSDNPPKSKPVSPSKEIPQKSPATVASNEAPSKSKPVAPSKDTPSKSPPVDLTNETPSKTKPSKNNPPRAPVADPSNDIPSKTRPVIPSKETPSKSPSTEPSKEYPSKPKPTVSSKDTPAKAPVADSDDTPSKVKPVSSKDTPSKSQAADSTNDLSPQRPKPAAPPKDAPSKTPSAASSSDTPQKPKPSTPSKDTPPKSPSESIANHNPPKSQPATPSNDLPAKPKPLAPSKDTPSDDTPSKSKPVAPPKDTTPTASSLSPVPATTTSKDSPSKSPQASTTDTPNSPPATPSKETPPKTADMPKETPSTPPVPSKLASSNATIETPSKLESTVPSTDVPAPPKSPPKDTTAPPKAPSKDIPTSPNASQENSPKKPAPSGDSPPRPVQDVPKDEKKQPPKDTAPPKSPPPSGPPPGAAPPRRGPPLPPLPSPPAAIALPEFPTAIKAPAFGGIPLPEVPQPMGIGGLSIPEPSINVPSIPQGISSMMDGFKVPSPPSVGDNTKHGNRIDSPNTPPTPPKSKPGRKPSANKGNGEQTPASTPVEQEVSAPVAQTLEAAPIPQSTVMAEKLVSSTESASSPSGEKSENGHQPELETGAFSNKPPEKDEQQSSSDIDEQTENFNETSDSPQVTSEKALPSKYGRPTGYTGAAPAPGPAPAPTPAFTGLPSVPQPQLQIPVSPPEAIVPLPNSAGEKTCTCAHNHHGPSTDKAPSKHNPSSESSSGGKNTDNSNENGGKHSPPGKNQNNPVPSQPQAPSKNNSHHGPSAPTPSKNNAAPSAVPPKGNPTSASSPGKNSASKPAPEPVEDLEDSSNSRPLRPNKPKRPVKPTGGSKKPKPKPGEKNADKMKDMDIPEEEEPLILTPNIEAAPSNEAQVPFPAGNKLEMDLTNLNANNTGVDPPPRQTEMFSVVTVFGWEVPIVNWAYFTEFFQGFFVEKFRTSAGEFTCDESDDASFKKRSELDVDYLCGEDADFSRQDVVAPLESGVCNMFCNSNGFSGGMCMPQKSCLCFMSEKKNFAIKLDKLPSYGSNSTGKATGDSEETCLNCRCLKSCQNEGKYVGYCSKSCHCGVPWYNDIQT